MSNRPNTKPNQRRSASTESGKRIVAAERDSRAGVWIVVIGSIAILGCLLIAVIVAGRGSGGDATVTDTAKATGITVVPAGTTSFGKVTVDGQALPDRPDGATTDPAVGATVPTLVGQQLDGSAITVPSSGKPKVVMFLAHWCPHCQKEVPLISEHLRTQGLPEGVDLFAVATSTSEEAPNYPPGAWLTKESWPVPTLVDDEAGAAAAAYGIGGFPFFAVVDASGKVVMRTSGELTMAQFDQLVAAAKSGTAPSAA